MKKIIISVIALLYSSISFAFNSNDIQGSWKIDNVVYTFDKDTMFIDEIGVEGDAYIYKIVDNAIIAVNTLGDELIISINNVTDNNLTLTIVNGEFIDKFALKKLKSYNFYEVSR